LKKFVFLVLFFLLGCQSPNTANFESEASLADLKKAIVSAIGEPKAVSENQREFTSQFYGRKSGKERLYSVVTILGARRPYEIDIKVFVEQKTGKNYEQIGEDPTVAKKLKSDIEARLHSRENRNVIDDFRPF
jgi:hypothetical protein